MYTNKSAQTAKKIMKHADILTRNKTGEPVIYGNANINSNFKSLFKSMVSNQNLNQVGIDEFFRALQYQGVKKDYITVEPLLIKYSNVAPYCTN